MTELECFIYREATTLRWSWRQDTVLSCWQISAQWRSIKGNTPKLPLPRARDMQENSAAVSGFTLHALKFHEVFPRWFRKPYLVIPRGILFFLFLSFNFKYIRYCNVRACCRMLQFDMTKICWNCCQSNQGIWTIPPMTFFFRTVKPHLFTTLLRRTVLFSCLFYLTINGGGWIVPTPSTYYVFIIWFRTKIETLVKPSLIECSHAIR